MELKEMHNWWELLPEPYSGDPDVVLMYCPNGSVFKRVATTDGKYSFIVMENHGRMVGLQVEDSTVGTWPEQERVFNDYQIPMAQPIFIGPVSKAPDGAFLNEGLIPMMFLKAAHWRTGCSPRAYLKHLTDQSSKGVTN